MGHNCAIEHKSDEDKWCLHPLHTCTLGHWQLIYWSTGTAVSTGTAQHHKRWNALRVWLSEALVASFGHLRLPPERRIRRWRLSTTRFSLYAHFETLDAKTLLLEELFSFFIPLHIEYRNTIGSNSLTLIDVFIYKRFDYRNIIFLKLMQRWPEGGDSLH